jgi:hypothetical protein
MPLAGIAAVASIIAMSVTTVSAPCFGTTPVPLGIANSRALVGYVLIPVGVYALAMAINLLAPTLAGKMCQVQALEVATSISTAAVGWRLWPDPWAGHPGDPGAVEPRFPLSFLAGPDEGLPGKGTSLTFATGSRNQFFSCPAMAQVLNREGPCL